MYGHIEGDIDDLNHPVVRLSRRNCIGDVPEICEDIIVRYLNAFGFPVLPDVKTQ